MSISVKNKGGIGDTIKRIITARHYFPDKKIYVSKSRKSRLSNSQKLINFFPNVYFESKPDAVGCDKPILITKIKTIDKKYFPKYDINEKFIVCSLRCSTFGKNIDKGNFLEYRNFPIKTIFEMEDFLIKNCNVKVLLQHETDISTNAWLADNCEYSFHVDSGMPWFFHQFIKNGSCLVNWSRNLVKNNQLSKSYLDHQDQLRQQGWDIIDESITSWKDEFVKILDSKKLLKK